MKILVIGDSCIDRFVYGEVKRVAPEAPAPVLDIIWQDESIGMAGNTVRNLINLFGSENVGLITNACKNTKTRWIEQESNHLIMRSDDDRHKDDETFNFKESKPDILKSDCIVISDYNKGFLTKDDIIKISEQNLTFLDSKRDLNPHMLASVDFIKLNNAEAERYEEPIDERFIVTKGSKGAVWNGIEFPVERLGTHDLTGAGDVFLAGLVYEYMNSNNIETAIKFANKCANISVRKRGTGLITKEDLI